MGISAIFYILLETILNFPVTFAFLFGLPVLVTLVVILAPFRHWQRGKLPALISAIFAGIIAFYALPLLFHSSLSEMSYLTDWLFHIACIFVVMIYVYFVVWFIFTPSQIYSHRNRKII